MSNGMIPFFYENVNLGGRPATSLGDEPCLKKSRNILKDAVTYTEHFASDQKISREDALKMISKEFTLEK